MAYKDSEKEKAYHRNYYQEHKKEVTEKQRIYRQTEEGKMVQEKYNQSDKGKVVRKRIYKKYDQSGKRNTPERKLRKKFNNIKRNYGLSQSEYDRMFREQNGVCAACGELETRKKNGKVVFLSVDHDHKTGKVRGLLCSSCNFALGHVKEDIDILVKLAAYLLKDTI